MQEHISESDYLEELLRGTGRTTSLLKKCLPNAIFLVGSEAMAKNIRSIAHNHGRYDIHIMSYKSLLSGNVTGREDVSEIVCDHFLRMTVDEWNQVYLLKRYFDSLTKKKIIKTLQNIFE